MTPPASAYALLFATQDYERAAVESTECPNVSGDLRTLERVAERIGDFRAEIENLIGTTSCAEGGGTKYDLDQLILEAFEGVMTGDAMRVVSAHLTVPALMARAA